MEASTPFENGDLYYLTRYSSDATNRSLAEGVYRCAIADASDVYEGNTISNVQILVSAVDIRLVEQLGEVFPNIVLKASGIYVENGVRITGIDTPEIRLSKRKRDGTPRSEQSCANEKETALSA